MTKEEKRIPGEKKANILGVLKVIGGGLLISAIGFLIATWIGYILLAVTVLATIFVATTMNTKAAVTDLSKPEDPRATAYKAKLAQKRSSKK